MAVGVGDNRTQRWQINIVVGVEVRLVGGSERVIAVRARGQCGHDDVVGGLGQGTSDTGAAMTTLLGAIGTVGLLALRWRQAGVVRRLGWSGKLGLQCRHTLGRRQDQRDQIILGQGKKGCTIHGDR